MASSKHAEVKPRGAHARKLGGEVRLVQVDAAVWEAFEENKEAIERALRKLAKAKRKPKKPAATRTGKTLVSDDDTRKHLSELLEQDSDRACALIGGAMLDDALCYLLEEKEERAFGARIADAFQRSLLPAGFRGAFEEIREIRNSAAHVLGTPEEPWTFARKEFGMASGDAASPRTKFVTVVVALASETYARAHLK